MIDAIMARVRTRSVSDRCLRESFLFVRPCVMS